MKKFWLLVLSMLVLSLISGYLISKMSFIGKVGINFFYREYAIFKVWWQTAALFFGIQFTLILLQTLAKTKWISWIVLILAVAGLVITFIDFNNEFSHKILREKFHVGFYLFFIATIMHSIYFLLSDSRKIKPV